MKKHVIELDDYEVANLKAALRAIGCGWYQNGVTRFASRSPLFAMNTGDWVCQIAHKLPEVDYVPNVQVEELAERARTFK